MFRFSETKYIKQNVKYISAVSIKQKHENKLNKIMKTHREQNRDKIETKSIIRAVFEH